MLKLFVLGLTVGFLVELLLRGRRGKSGPAAARMDEDKVSLAQDPAASEPSFPRQLRDTLLLPFAIVRSLGDSLTRVIQQKWQPAAVPVKSQVQVDRNRQRVKRPAG